MSNKQIVVFISGSGSNLQNIIDRIDDYSLCANIAAVVSNNEHAPGNNIAKKHNIPLIIKKWEKHVHVNRVSYDYSLAFELIGFCGHIDLIVLAGWMHVFTSKFFEASPCKNIINLHPALPGKFPGKQAIHDAWTAYQNGEITETGIMVHKVVPEIDDGPVIVQTLVPIYLTDAFETFRQRMISAEKPLLIEGINKALYCPLHRNGKACNIYHNFNNNNSTMLIEYSDRMSCRDRHLDIIPGKGLQLAKQTSFWFKLLESELGIQTHFIRRHGSHLLVHQCRPIKLEVIVRGNLTGSLSKKLAWPGFNDSTFFNDLESNDPLPHPICTPTTKSDDHDQPISFEQAIDNNVVSKSEAIEIEQMALKIFTFARNFLMRYGLTLADTKYEFGRSLIDNSIVLIDECHTSDSSRIWVNDDNKITYDKDIVRHMTTENSTFIPDSLKNLVLRSYRKYTNILCDSTDNITKWIDRNLMVVIVAGSKSDEQFVHRITQHLQWPYKIYYLSAHKNTEALMKMLKCVPTRLYITVAGRSNALSGVIAANTTKPVIACPPFVDKLDMLTNIQSTLQMPSQTPVMTILDPGNVALAIDRIIQNS